MTDRHLFVPGRLCLFGEHSDWAGGHRTHNPRLVPGYCLAVGTTQGIHARVASDGNYLRVDSQVVAHDYPAWSVPMSPTALHAAAQSNNFYAYCAGVASHIYDCYSVGGVSIQTLGMSLPLKRGLSSSAAVCVLTARAFNRAYNLGLSVREEMECAYIGELRTGSQCGRMDQICAYGQTPVFLVFDGDHMDVQPLEPRAPLPLVIVDLKKGKDTRKILSDLNVALLADSNIGADVREALGPQNVRLLAQARDALVAGDGATLGALMQEAQKIFDRLVAPACPSELIAPKLHAVLNHPRVRELSWGGKGVGSQGDGSAQLIARNSEAQEVLMRELPALLDVECFDLTVVANGKGGGR